MRSATIAFMQELSNGNRNYQATVEITLADDTVIYGTKTTYNYFTGTETVESVPYLTNENIWENGFTIEDAVSNDDEFQVGAAIINQFTLVISNTDEQYNEYDFIGAVVTPHVSLLNRYGTSMGTVDLGVFNVDNADYDDGIISLTCLDNMAKFDKVKVGRANWSTLYDVVADCCTSCGVVLKNSNFPHYDMSVNASRQEEVLSSSGTTYRQILSWCAQMAGCFARCGSDGRLEIKFYDFDTLNSVVLGTLNGGTFDSGTPVYETGDDADGGSFNPWNTGYIVDGGSFTSSSDIQIITSVFSDKLDISDVTITGLNVTGELTGAVMTWLPIYSSSLTYSIGEYVKNGDMNIVYQCNTTISTPEAFNENHWTKVSSITESTNPGGSSSVSNYDFDISGNGLIKDNDIFNVYYALYADFVSNRTSPIKFRRANIDSLSNPTIEAGDVAIFIDKKGRSHPIIVSSTTFSIGNAQNVVSSVAPPSRRIT